MDIAGKFEDFRKETDRILFERDSLSERMGEAEARKESLVGSLALYAEARNVLNSLILKTRDDAISLVESVVDGALEDVFPGRGLRLRLRPGEGTRVSLAVRIEEDGELYDLESSRGGGLRDLVSVAVLVCFRRLKGITLPLILDESLKYLHSTGDNAYKRNAYAFLGSIARRLGTQIILVTGEEDAEALRAADNVISVRRDGNGSHAD